MKYMYCCGTQLINLETEENQRKGLGEFWCDKCNTTYRTEIYSSYSPEHDITFIMEDTNISYDQDKEDEIYEEQVTLCSEVIGCYKGEPTDENTDKYYGNPFIDYFESKENIEKCEDLPEEIKKKIEYLSDKNTQSHKKTMCDIIMITK